MTSEEKVKQLWPGAFIESGSFQWVAKISRHLCAYGSTKENAWDNAWESINPYKELTKGEAK